MSTLRERGRATGKEGQKGKRVSKLESKKVTRRNANNVKT